MKKRNFYVKISAVIISLALIAAMALCMTSCGKTEAPADTSSISTVKVAEKSFKFTVVDAEGTAKNYDLKTQKTTLGEALLEAGIITEEEQKTGFINTVNGVTLNWDTDKAYWALYVGDTFAEKGVNETAITADGVYSFVYTKG